MTEILARTVVTPDGSISPGRVVVADGRIRAVERAAGPVPDRLLLPGFVDLQVNGHGDISVAEATGGDWDRLDAILASHGVTTWCPTLVSQARDRYPPALERIANAQARGGRRPHIAGAHLEGPFLAPARAGAHPPTAIAPLDPPWLDQLPEVVRIVTLAPELPGAIAAIESLVERDVVVGLGHSDADHETTCRAADAGARLVTHLFNASRPLHHREPGLPGAALVDPRLTVSVIPDLVHLHPSVVELAFRAKGSHGVVLVTDAVASASSTDLDTSAGAARMRDGTLAGSTLSMVRGVANVLTATRVTLEDAVRAAATTPAERLGLSDRGRIAVGARADLVAVDAHFDVLTTWIAGEVAFQAQAGRKG